MNISNTFKGENHIVEMGGEVIDDKDSITLDAESERFSESIWCGANGLDYLKEIKEHQPELDENINKKRSFLWVFGTF